MSTKHTPGPWSLQNSRVVDQKGFCIDTSAYDTVAILESWDSKTKSAHWSEFEGETFIERSDEEQNANAKLIAAAPDLLEALINVFEHAKLIINDNHVDYEKAIAAIKKATE